MPDRADLTKVKRSRALRGLLALVVMMALALSTVAPAYAGTLTAASFAASTPYTYTGAQSTRYDYGFTTATTSTLSRVTMSVPAGTSGANRYLDLNGTTGNYASTPDTPFNSITGSIDVRVKVQLPTYTPATQERLVSKWSAGQHAFNFLINTGGYLALSTSTDGTNTVSQTSTTALSLAGGTTIWLRATFTPNTSSNHQAIYYTSPDGSTWTQLGSAITNSGISPMIDTTAPLEIGTGDYGSSLPTTGKIYYAELRNGIGGTVVNSFDPTLDTISGTSWNSASTNAELWTVNQSGANLPADISSDLVASSVSGLTSASTARLRTIQEIVVFSIPTPVSVPSGTPCTVSLQGFNNTATPGSYTSLITTYDNSVTPVAVDSVTTSAVVFAADSSNTTTSVTIDPSMTFTVSGQASVCNGQSATNFQTGSTASAVTLGHLSPSTVGGGAQALSIADNAGGGFTVYLRTAGTTPNAMRDTNSHSIADVTGTNASPGSVPTAGTAGFGYTSGDTSTPFTSNTWAKLTNSNDSVLIGSAGTYSKSACVGYEVAVAPATAASSYSATVVYTAVPVF